VAYRIKDYQVSGPDWLAGARFDIVAKLPEGATRDQAPEMLQALLADHPDGKPRRPSSGRFLPLPAIRLIVV